MGKRMVSKGRYVAVQGERASLILFGAALALLSIPFGFMAAIGIIFCVINLFIGLRGQEPLAPAGTTLLVTGLCSGLAYAAWRGGQAILNQAENIDPGVPLTRANTADLPAPDTLVRASEEPRQEQQVVLLRPASSGQETPPEQLVRASARHDGTVNA